MLSLSRVPLDVLKAGLDATSEKVVVLDDRGRIVLANASWREMFSRERRDAADFGLGQTLPALSILNVREDAEAKEFLAAIDRILAGQAAACTRICRSSVAGSARWYKLHAARLSLGRWTGVAVTLKDVSDAQRAKQAINRLSLRLNGMREQERERIALELHDSTAQHLVAASLSLVALRDRASLSARDADILDDVERSLQVALHEVQLMSFGLYTPRLDEGGLRSTLEQFIRTYARQTGIQAELRAPPLDGLAQGLQQTVLRIIQEALTNVHRHAAASSAAVRLRMTRQSIQLVIADNGKGMDPARRSDSGTGIGISGMRARVDQFGGTLRVRSRPGQGTRILVQIPLPSTRRRPEIRRFSRPSVQEGDLRLVTSKASSIRAKGFDGAC